MEIAALTNEIMDSLGYGTDASKWPDIGDALRGASQMESLEPSGSYFVPEVKVLLIAVFALLLVSIWAWHMRKRNK